MNSCLYQGVLRHRRLQPKAHHFVYRLFMAWLDLDELDKLPERASAATARPPLHGTTPIIRWARR